jgi:translin
MLDKKVFAKIKKEIARYEEKRESLIRESRDIIRLSKQIIYALQRNDVKKAGSLSKNIKLKVKKLPSDDYSTGMKRVALQEYVEAMALLGFVKSGKIPTPKALGVGNDEYLAGIADLTGELVRMAVNRAINKKNDEVFSIKELVDAVYGEFLQIDLRNSELRKKADQIKWNMQKLADVAYDISKNK